MNIRVRIFIKRIYMRLIAPISGKFPLYGIWIYFPKASFVFKIYQKYDTYEPDILKIILSYVKEQSFFIDIGANIGNISAFVLRNTNTTKIISIEPSPNSFRYLLKTRNAAFYKDRWQIIKKAVGSSEGTVNFSYTKNSRDGVFDGIFNTGRGCEMSTTEVALTALDSIWNELGQPYISLIKMDVEGHEYYVFEGATSCIEKNRPVIILEWNKTNLKANNVAYESLLDVAKRFKYNIYSIPNMVRVDEKEILKLQMIFHENFLLIPKQ